MKVKTNQSGSMFSTTQNNNNRRVETETETSGRMTRFSVDGPPTSKRVRFTLPPQSDQPSQSRALPVDEEEDEDEDLVHVEDVESDPQDSDEYESEDEDEEEPEVEVIGSEDEDNNNNNNNSNNNNNNNDDGDDSDDDVPISQRRNERMTVSKAAYRGRGLLHVSAASADANGAPLPVITDPDVLDCPICLETLCVPVFQCENGHIACSSCCSKVNRKCPSCCMPIGYNRCRGLEKVIESVKVPCKNTRYGCTEMTPYSKKSEHEQMCLHVTCFCPHPSCSFAGCSKNLYLHFSIQHAGCTTRFTFETTFSVNLTTDRKHFFLQEQQDNVIFILNQEVREGERAFSIDCVGPLALKTCFVHQLTVGDMDGSEALYMRRVPDVYTKWSEHALKSKYLVVPNDEFVHHNGTLSIQVRKTKATSVSRP